MENICIKISKKENIISISNYNSYKNITISGNKLAIIKAIKIFKFLGARIVPININIPSHCLLMKPIIYEFKNFLDKIIFNKPEIIFINNINCKYEKSPEKIKNYLVKQLYSTVNWVGCLNFIKKKNIFNVIEFTPKKILKKISKPILNDLNISSIYDLKSFLVTLKKYKI
ncbi:ACP S-malonyltransferase [Enterobacteriaceae endosymbiont of Donacia semicuprea]|uniref:ACP S-malonyltransferase n=1 Tax=Enterobacteriaceae endosymbiont of Donacia semicuprea TaxID=2675783 RepID=UPI001448CEE3|nr:ACP S-malonyltransferase [Enterobacteriaceae endosymbiont of Donacia semicuprea]QJC32772.1 hypothetical protein GJT91_00420 [Enterobacteriaceae endosymbiont of Donacia semicuprea]